MTQSFHGIESLPNPERFKQPLSRNGMTETGFVRKLLRVAADRYAQGRRCGTRAPRSGSPGRR